MRGRAESRLGDGKEVWGMDWWPFSRPHRHEQCAPSDRNICSVFYFDDNPSPFAHHHQRATPHPLLAVNKCKCMNICDEVWKQGCIHRITLLSGTLMLVECLPLVAVLQLHRFSTSTFEHTFTDSLKPPNSSSYLSPLDGALRMERRPST